MACCKAQVMRVLKKITPQHSKAFHYDNFKNYCYNNKNGTVAVGMEASVRGGECM